MQKRFYIVVLSLLSMVLSFTQVSYAQSQKQPKGYIEDILFAELELNDNDVLVTASYDEKKAKIANLDYVDDGGKDIKPATIRMREHKMDFTLPDIPHLHTILRREK